VSDPPRIVHLVYSLGTGGLENGLVNIINRTPPQRYRHAIVCIDRSGPFAGRLQGDVPVIELRKRPGHDLGCYRRLLAALAVLQPALVHSRNLAALEMQLAVALRRGVRRVHGEHGRDLSDLDGSNWKYRLLRRSLRPLIHGWIAVSEDLASYLRRDIGVRAAQVHQLDHGVDSERFAVPGTDRCRQALPAGFLPPDGLLVGTVGRLAGVKDQQSLLAAFAQLRSAAPDLAPRLRLALVGDGPERAALAAQAVALGIADATWFAGDRSDVPALLAALDLFALPSLAEGISNTVLEAMASGVPVVATDVGGNPELVKPGVNGVLVPVGDAAALAQALLVLLRDDTGRRDMGRQAREWVSERFHWDRTVERYLAVYDQVIAQGQGRAAA